MKWATTLSFFQVTMCKLSAPSVHIRDLYYPFQYCMTVCFALCLCSGGTGFLQLLQNWFNNTGSSSLHTQIDSPSWQRSRVYWNDKQEKDASVPRKFGKTTSLLIQPIQMFWEWDKNLYEPAKDEMHAWERLSRCMVASQ